MNLCSELITQTILLKLIIYLMIILADDLHPHFFFFRLSACRFVSFGDVLMEWVIIIKPIKENKKLLVNKGSIACMVLGLALESMIRSCNQNKTL